MCVVCASTVVSPITLKNSQQLTHIHAHMAPPPIPPPLHTTQAFVLLLNLAPLQHVSCCVKVPFKSLYFITRSFYVATTSDILLLFSLSVRFTTFSGRSVTATASTHCSHITAGVQWRPGPAAGDLQG